MQIQPDIIASVTARCDLSGSLSLSDYIVPEEGYCIAVRALDDKAQYNQLEDTSEEFHTVEAGDVIVGVLGERRALHGYSGKVPRQIEVGDTLHLLNLGGIIGESTTPHPDYGPALAVEVLGAVVEGGRHASIKSAALPPVDTLTESAPLVVVSGTSMNTGKTHAACTIVEGLAGRGLRVAAAKLTGAALMRDVRKMKDHGAVTCATFADAGLASSTGTPMAPVAKGIIQHLNTISPDVIVLEMGAGLIGYYGVDALLQDQELQRLTASHVVTAMNLTDAWAAKELFQKRYGAPITAISGPVTDGEAGIQYIAQRFGTAAINAQRSGRMLADRVAETLSQKAQPAATAPVTALS